MNEEFEKKLNQEIRDREFESANIRVNYMSNIIILFVYILVKDMESFMVIGIEITSLKLILLTAILIVILYWKEFRLYSNFLVRKFLLGVKK